MINIIKADLYRIIRQKGLYITAICFITLVVLQVSTGSVGRIGVSTDLLPAVDFNNLTGINAAFASMSLVDNYLYFMLPLIIIVADVDFSSGAIKNVVASGCSRVEYYLSKLILAMVFCIILLLLNVIISLITATIINGFGGQIDKEVILRFIKIFLPQLYIFLSVTSVGVFLVFITKRTSAAISLYIAFCMLPTVIIFILSEISEKVLKLINYDIVGNLRVLSITAGATSEHIERAILIGTVYLLLSIIGSVFLFKKSEIK
jgi:ABC-2 type transport system permease protein